MQKVAVYSLHILEQLHQIQLSPVHVDSLSWGLHSECTS